jgi:hypothetical protein
MRIKEEEINIYFLTLHFIHFSALKPKVPQKPFGFEPTGYCENARRGEIPLNRAQLR